MIDLYIEFNNMDRMPLFEIEYNGEYYIYNIIATKDGLAVLHSDVSVEWEQDYTLDYHLEGLYELCYEDAVEQYNEEHDFNMSIDGACDYIIGHGIATEEELQLIAHINGYSIETLDSVVYARTGFNTVEQFYNEEQGA